MLTKTRSRLPKVGIKRSHHALVDGRHPPCRKPDDTLMLTPATRIAFNNLLSDSNGRCDSLVFSSINKLVRHSIRKGFRAIYKTAFNDFLSSAAGIPAINDVDVDLFYRVCRHGQPGYISVEKFLELCKLHVRSQPNSCFMAMEEKSCDSSRCNSQFKVRKAWGAKTMPSIKRSVNQYSIHKAAGSYELQWDGLPKTHKKIRLLKQLARKQSSITQIAKMI